MDLKRALAKFYIGKWSVTRILTIILSAFSFALLALSTTPYLYDYPEHITKGYLNYAASQPWLRGTDQGFAGRGSKLEKEDVEQFQSVLQVPFVYEKSMFPYWGYFTKESEGGLYEEWTTDFYFAGTRMLSGSREAYESIAFGCSKAVSRPRSTKWRGELMFQIKDLVKTYTPKGAEPVMALRGITVDFGETGMVFILGKSGCGKSTLLHVMGGLDYPTAGELVIDGKSSKDFTKEDYDNYRNTYVGFVFQEYNLLPEFTVYENLAIALQLQGKKADKALLEEYLKRVDLEVDEKRRPTQLSGGQKQRVAIARALIKDPKIIFADEPTGALDAKTGNDILTLLKSLSKDRLVIVVSHDEEFARTFGDRVLEMSDGLIVADSAA